MRAFLIRLRAEEPLVITSGSSESMAHETLGHIPGNMLLGAFAAAWKRVYRNSDPNSSPAFRRLFLDGSVSWGMAAPLCGDEVGVPIPRCYMRQKNRKGLPRADEKADSHVVINLLRLTDGDELSQSLQQRGLLAPGEAPKLKKIDPAFMGRSSLRLAEEKRGWNIHVALGSQRSALEGQLFGYSSIAAGAEFCCRLLCRDASAGQALHELLAETKSFHVGRSRSAGYGRVCILDISEEEQDSEELPIRAGQEVAFYLLSHYMPSPSWLQPVESLLAELEQLCGAKPTLQKKFCTYAEIQGYNALWKKPRASRTALEQGSVFLCTFAGNIRLPRKFMLGADQVEGYGRIELEPPFLDRGFPVIPHDCVKSENPAVPAPGSSPVWNTIRRRALHKLCEERAYAILLEKNWQKFVETAAENARPSASQRGNIRRIITELSAEQWTEAFSRLLDNSKTAGEQWKNSVAFNPFEGGNNYLDVIMKELLSATRSADFCPDAAALPGGTADSKEMRSASQKAHQLFMMRLLAAWNRAYLAREGGRD